jgi:hypothetical protein
VDHFVDFLERHEAPERWPAKHLVDFTGAR